jgi:hypothetical protein
MRWLTGIFSKNPVPLPPLLIEGVDYSFVEVDLGEPIQAIKILGPHHTGVIYYYGYVKVIPLDGEHRLAFQYTIWDSAGFHLEELKESVDFKRHLGDILVSIIADEQHRGEYNAPRIDHTEKFDL